MGNFSLQKSRFPCNLSYFSSLKMSLQKHQHLATEHKWRHKSKSSDRTSGKFCLFRSVTTNLTKGITPNLFVQQTDPNGNQRIFRLKFIKLSNLG